MHCLIGHLIVAYMSLFRMLYRHLVPPSFASSLHTYRFNSEIKKDMAISRILCSMHAVPREF